MAREKEKVIDHEARQMALAAQTQLDGHEKSCAERWSETRDALKALFGAQRQTVWALVGGQGVVILFLAGLIVTLAFGGK